mmetsp:Transcript_8981/g.18641  ORF Transcript_8981/g.18641 Transcript_8981/m.18641 type:complete len:316 (+) Transcript_8981:93-1040(+)
MAYTYPGEGKKCCGSACNGSCTCCPFGCTYTAPIIFATIAVATTWSCFLSCHFFQSKQDFLEYDTNGRFAGEFGVGPWLVQDFNFSASDGGLVKSDGDGSTCVGWSSHEILDTDDLDGALRFARIAIMPTAFIGFVCFCVFICGACLPLDRGCLRICSVMFLTFSALMILSLTALASDWCKDAEDCTLNFGGVAAILSCLFWLGAGLTICCMREPTKGVEDLRISSSQQPYETEMTDMAQAAPTETIVEQTIVEADGTTVKLTTRTLTSADGSKTVTETREVMQQGNGKGAPTVATSSTASGFGGGYPTAKAINY